MIAVLFSVEVMSATFNPVVFLYSLQAVPISEPLTEQNDVTELP
jgi:hypothetical protein